ncbi:cell cycle checkpoint control protein RAD9A-like isoform X3 [Scyliorhinus torazame]|uniref:cell cycle checkpoint control protein RAD9A-like isoform X3 n=1 Tax=Scyliorhinus torazame TaxID=75743 RepID=UPI003B5C72A9
MRCLVSGGNVSVIGRAIHALSRLGDDCYLEALEEGLALRTVNSSRSAFASFLFAPAFFQKYEHRIPPAAGDTEYSGSNTENFRCKIVMKVRISGQPLVSGLQNCHTASLQRGRSWPFLSRLRRWRRRWRNVRWCWAADPIISSSSCCANTELRKRTTYRSRTARRCRPSTQRRPAPTHCERSPNPKKTMLTELALTVQEFDEFCIEEECEITFCLKELRGLLGFAESSGLPLTVHFKGPGSPAIFSLQEAVLEVNFVLATLADADSQASLQAPAARDHPGTNRIDDDFMSEEIDSYMIAMETTAMEEMLAVGSKVTVEVPVRSPTFPLAHLAKRPLADEEATQVEEEDDPEIPATPPHKKQFRSLFFGSLMSRPEAARTSNPGHEVLVEASDSDGEV